MSGTPVDLKLEVVVIPVSDVDRAKAFYMEQVGFELHVDHSAGEDFRVVQLNPPGSACSIVIHPPLFSRPRIPQPKSTSCCKCPSSRVTRSLSDNKSCCK